MPRTRLVGSGLSAGPIVLQCYSKIARCMAKNGNPTRGLELSARALEAREKKREEEPLKYAACCNDRAGLTSLTSLSLLPVQVTDCILRLQFFTKSEQTLKEQRRSLRILKYLH